MSSNRPTQKAASSPGSMTNSKLYFAVFHLARPNVVAGAQQDPQDPFCQDTYCQDDGCVKLIRERPFGQVALAGRIAEGIHDAATRKR